MKLTSKNNSWLMKFLSKILFFNKQFMTSYVTTIGDTIYFPDGDRFNNIDVITLITSHELVHINQSKRLTIPLFWFLYLFPQCLALLAILAIPLFFFSMYAGLAALGFILFLAPIPAYWRAKYELEGYLMSLVAKSIQMNQYKINWKQIDESLRIDAEFYNQQFTGAGYYFMWPFGMKEKLIKVIDRIEAGDISEDERQLFTAASDSAKSFIDKI